MIIECDAADGTQLETTEIPAGDIGAPEIIPALEKLAPVTAIRGNIDQMAWCRRFPETEVVELGGGQGCGRGGPGGRIGVGCGNPQDGRRPVARRRRRPPATAVRRLEPQRQRCWSCGGSLWVAYHSRRRLTFLDEVVQFTLVVRRCRTPACARYRRAYRPEEESGACRRSTRRCASVG